MKQHRAMAGWNLLANALTMLGALLLVSAAVAQEREPGTLAGGHQGAAAGWQRLPQQSWVEEYARGYSAGRVDERERGPGGERPDAFLTGLAANDLAQNEAQERLEHAGAELRRALDLIRRQPSLPRVQGALVHAREALHHIENAIAMLPELPGRAGERRYERLRGFGPERASGGWEG